MKQFLIEKLAALVERQNRLEFWCRLAICWACAALLGLGLIILQHQIGWSSWISLPLVVLLALVAVALVVPRSQMPDNWREVARQIEVQFPELDGRLLTAVQQDPADGKSFGFLQERLLQEAVQHSERHNWSGSISNRRMTLAQTAHWAALALLGLVLFQLRVGVDRKFMVAKQDSSITVSPGDVSLERGSALVVLARFAGTLPPNVEMVIGDGATNTHIPLVKSLADPMFGGSLADVASNLVYHVEYPGHSTRNYRVTVFEYPRLQRADVDVTSPAYTGEPHRHIENTRRVSAVEGSSLEISLQLNKPVTSARLVPKKAALPVVPLLVESNRPFASLSQLSLDSSQTYDLQLLDEEGRTNKVPAQFVFEALKNRPPELRLVSPRGDLRPSPLEEVSFEGSVWDDFGVTGYGIGYSVAGQTAKFIPLGENVPGKQKRPFQYMLRLEDLEVKPDELVSWFVWADDKGPDGEVRRTVGDLFFGEIRPFDEVFKEGQGMQGQGEGQGEQSGGNQTARLAELQKQIISATWNLQRQGEHPVQPAARPPGKPTTPPGPESRNDARPTSSAFGLARVSAPLVMGQVRSGDAPSDSESRRSAPVTGQTSGGVRPTSGNADDLGVVRDSQAQALEQATVAAERARDPRVQALWSAAMKQMDQALAELQRATNSTARLRDALAAEQAAYQALLKLQEHEYQVSRQRNNRQSGGSRQQQMERQLDQMDLTQSEDRYEKQTQAQAPQNSQRREQLQVMNRLQELARRQKDLNDRLKELQSALQEARTEQEKAELQRRLKRLQEEEQQMLADVDELRQRMDKPENQSRMADERRQLDQTREDVQRAAEAASQGSASQALASGTRAERQFQQMRDQLRKENSSEFAEDLRSMRAQARELAQRQLEIQQSMQGESSMEHKSLSDAADHKDVLEQLNRQKQLMTNLVERAGQVSQQAETSEPLLSSQLYDTVRKFTQDSAKNVREIQDDLLGRGLMPGNLLETLKNESEPDGAKLLDVTSEMLRRDFLPQASHASKQAGDRIEELKRGVERAAESVLGNDTEALRLAQQELDQLAGQLQREMAQGQPQSGQTNGASGQESVSNSSQQVGANSTNAQPNQAGGSQSATTAANQPGSSGQAGSSDQPNQPGARENPSLADITERQTGTADSGSPQGSEQNARPGNRRAQGRQARTGQNPTDAAAGEQAGAEDWTGSSSQYGAGGGGGWNFDRFLNDPSRRRSGPITGEDFLPWSDRLREVEEIVEQPDLRNEIAAARERARLLRQEYKRERKKPDWAVVKTQVMNPLTQVRDRISDELARRQSGEALVPIDRDPVPNRYSELVRRYYEELGKAK